MEILIKEKIKFCGNNIIKHIFNPTGIKNMLKNLKSTLL